MRGGTLGAIVYLTAVNAAACAAFSTRNGASDSVADAGSGSAGSGDAGSGDASSATPKLVFLSTTVTNGNIKGDAGDALMRANTICDDDAHIGGIDANRTFVAWLSRSGSISDSKSMQSLLNRSDGPWFLPGGARVADSFAELTNTGPRTPIVENIRKTIVADAQVWTGTSNRGELGGTTDVNMNPNCNDWTLQAETISANVYTFGTFGVAGGDASTWSQKTFEGNFPHCDATLYLYCFEL
jgi:hypothetical protein